MGKYRALLRAPKLQYSNIVILAFRDYSFHVDTLYHSTIADSYRAPPLDTHTEKDDGNRFRYDFAIFFTAIPIISLLFHLFNTQ